ncbi:MAG: sugar transferase [Leptolyngbyaceae cyanobacterium CSU_1_4]|nr:sugar transferase [Leptolyngbyaceae cyanobacterium CSU_1_4]
MTTTPKVNPLASSALPDLRFNSPENQVAEVHESLNSKMKRCIDVVGALVGLGLTVVLVLPIAIAIYLDNPGAVLYRQERCGFRGNRFDIWKFRSMVTDADLLKHTVVNQAKGHIFKNDNDPRITRVGKFLRRTSLDELPQFWNVLMGDMSLVGTRPPTPNEVKNYNNRHWRRLEVKPGMTGEWQANGRSSVSDFEAIVDMDLSYIRNWSVLYDLQLILKTIQVVLHRKGAC